jgi:DNA-binding Lrp family transcriptional regulator
MLIRDTEQGLMRQLDQIDLEILQVLYQDARITNKKLASMVKLAPSSCLERVKRLHSEGVIKRFGINLDYKALGGNIEAMTAVRLNRHSTDIVRSFRDDLLAQLGLEELLVQ